MNIDSNTIWNEAGKAGLVFGLFSTLCLSLKQLVGLSGSSALTITASAILWAVEFFGCIFLMRRYLIRMRDRFSADMADCKSFGKRTALLSGLILAAAATYFILKMPSEETNKLIADATASLGSEERLRFAKAMDSFPLVFFFIQWFYCFIYGTILSSILSRYIIIEDIFKGGDDKL